MATRDFNGGKGSDITHKLGLDTNLVNKFDDITSNIYDDNDYYENVNEYNNLLNLVENIANLFNEYYPTEYNIFTDKINKLGLNKIETKGKIIQPKEEIKISEQITKLK
jgi:hypothetical protein